MWPFWKYPVYANRIGIVLVLAGLAVWSVLCTRNPEGVHDRDADRTVIAYGDLVSFQVVNDKVIVRTGEGDSQQIRVIDGRSLHELWVDTLPFLFYNLGQGKTPSVVLIHVLDEGILHATAFDLNGTLLFDKNDFHDGEVFPGHNGAYFHTDFQYTYRNRFIVFDRFGEELFSFPESIYEWHAASFNDSTVCYFADAAIQFLRIPTGDTMRTLSVSIGSDPFPIGPAVKTTSTGSHMVISWLGMTSFITPEIKVAWEMPIETAPYNAAISDDGRFVALYQGRFPQYELSLLEAAHGRVLWSETIHANHNTGISRWQDVLFSDDYLRVFDPQAYYLYGAGMPKPTTTHVFRINPACGALTGVEQFSGIMQVLSNEEMVRSFWVRPDSSNHIIVENW